MWESISLKKQVEIKCIEHCLILKIEEQINKSECTEYIMLPLKYIFC